jgi:hypothetical protein
LPGLSPFTAWWKSSLPRGHALCKGATPSYVMQDHLDSIAVITADGGVTTSIIRYLRFGDCRKKIRRELLESLRSKAEDRLNTPCEKK